MAVTLNKANLVLKDANGNIGKIEQLSNRDLAKIKTAVSDVALVVNQSNHKPIAATTTNKGVVQLATSADVVAGASDKVVTAEQLHNATTTIKATLDGAGNVITDTYVKKTGNETISGVKTFTGTVNAKGLIGFNSTQNGIGGGFANYINNNKVCDVWGQPNAGADGSISYINLRVKDYGTDNDLAYLAIAGNNKTKQGFIKFNGKNLVRSVNGVNADVNGKVQLGSLVAIPGEIKWFAFKTVPTGYLVCNGAQVSRTTYADLFKAIGTTFGSGNGSTTFNLPDLRDRYIIGANTNALGTKIAEQLPNIKGSLADDAYGHIDPGSNATLQRGAITYIKIQNSRGSIGNNESLVTGFTLDAHNSNSIYTDGGHVYPLSLALLPCIKY